jgi:CHAD domain-containing protein
VAEPLTMQRFARRQISSLLDNVVFDLHNAGKLKDAEAIHRMRVSIRRLSQALKVFEQYVPSRENKKINKQLHRVMQLSSRVRDLDIALKYLEKHGHATDGLVAKRLDGKRQLTEVLYRLSRPDLSLKWRMRLELETQ